MLAADRLRPKPAGASIGLAAALGGVLSLGLLLVTLGIRPDFAAAAAAWRFDLKLAMTSLALALALADCIRLASPQASGFGSRTSLLLPGAMVAALVAELFLVPASSWFPTMIGTNALVCLVSIPALALPPLMIGMLSMKSCAPASPALAGAGVGRLAAAVAASLYALHCFDDSPLFVTLWYSLATLPVIAAGALAGRFMLRW